MGNETPLYRLSFYIDPARREPYGGHAVKTKFISSQPLFMTLSDKLQSAFNLTDVQVRAILKVPEKIVWRAYNSTQRWKPGDRKYFKGALKHYQSQSRPIKSYEIVPTAFRDFDKIKAENERILDKISSEPVTFTCEICGTVKFHSALKHAWLNTKKIALEKADCGGCRDIIENL
jgi:hypothetical protein